MPIVQACASVQDENSPPREVQTAITPGGYLDHRFGPDAVQVDDPVTPAEDMQMIEQILYSTEVSELFSKLNR